VEEGITNAGNFGTLSLNICIFFLYNILLLIELLAKEGFCT